MSMCKNCGEYVEFEKQGEKEICPYCRWDQSEPVEKKLIEPTAKTDVKPNVDLVKLSGFLMIVLGIIECVLIVGFRDIYLGICIMRMKRGRCFYDAQDFQAFKIVGIATIIALDIIIASIVPGESPYSIPITCILTFLGILNGAMWILLRAKSVEAVFFSLPQ